ncbi:MAG: hypothetical protein M1834_007176 [Cirrosporium novae-zelandiae]|nr:MAG: hypothetical protein M1834_007176 [Cirrosporium novae-zelandiae]
MTTPQISTQVHPSPNSAPPSPLSQDHQSPLQSYPKDRSKTSCSTPDLEQFPKDISFQAAVENLRRMSQPEPITPKDTEPIKFPTINGKSATSNSTQSDGKEELKESPEDIGDFDWDDLERRYENAMAERSEAEDKIFQEFNGLVQIFSAWAQTASVHDSERALKRYSTGVETY